ncbi:MAG: hypothetical protein R3200_13850 [Xanthomonadales bacterium]|nr:hypothetical protein [Xanthomonadales bacterium]
MPTRFLIHIPKTAGTSLREMLQRASPRAACFPQAWRLMLNRGRYPSEEATLRAAQSGRYRFVAAHLPYAFAQRAGRLPCWVMVRDPVKRAISNLRHFQRRSPRHRGMELRSLVRRKSIVVNHLTNLQCQFLQDAVDPHAAFRATLEPPTIDLESALENLERCEFIGITERFDESIRLAEHTAGLKLPGAKHVNRRPAAAEPFSEALLKRLRSLNEADQFLYERACELFDERLKAMTDS